MAELCIYCGGREATTKDHVPPKSFFSNPRPNNLITVPCCERCNQTYGKDDERVRNLLTSLHTTEGHPSIRDQIAAKRDRSYVRGLGKTNFEHMMESIKIADVYSQQGIFLGSHPAVNLDQRAMDRFIERVTRALLYYENDIEHAKGKTDWRMAPTERDFESMPRQLKAFLSSVRPKQIGDNIFTYIGYYRPGKASSLWVMNFYGGVDLITIFRES